MAVQKEVGEVIAYKKGTGSYGTVPTASSAQALRRTEYNVALTKELLRNTEIRTDYQRPMPRHGLRRGAGRASGLLSGGTYAPFIASALRRDFSAVTNITSLTNVTATVGAPQFTRAAGSWISDGLRVGMVVRFTGWTTTGVANNSKNFTIIALTATAMTVAEAVAAKTSGDSLTVSIPGKISYVPTTGHTNDFFSIERWMPDASLSLRADGVRVGGFSVELSDNDNVTFGLDLMAQDVVKGAAQYFTSPTGEGSSTVYSSLAGAAFIEGVQVGVLTAFSLTQDSGMQPLKAVFVNKSPDVLGGPVAVSGRATLYLDSATYYDYFDQETSVAIVGRFDASSAATSDFFSFCLPNVSLAGGSIARGENALTISFDFEAGRGSAKTGFEDTTLLVQDSLAA
jgi:hypothetical protein